MKKERFIYLDKPLKPMTLIIGAKCKDGVVLIADKKVVEGTDIAKVDKIHLFSSLGIGFSGAGIGELFDKFLTRTLINIDSKVRTIKEEALNSGTDPKEVEKIISPYTYGNEFVEDCEGVLVEIQTKYNDIVQKNFGGLSVLIGFREGKEAKLHHINILDCLDSDRKTFIAIGSGAPYAQMFLKDIWDESSTMKQIAKAGYFIIEHIESSKIDGYVGEGTQAFFIPHLDERYDELVNKEERTPIEEKELNDKYAIRMVHDLDNIFPEVKQSSTEFKEHLKKLKDKLKED